jgi:hypothetical protein
MLDKFAKLHHIFPLVRWDLAEFTHQGRILDIGGGGEGVIGQAAGPNVFAVDCLLQELQEAPPGPQKIVMDARKLGFELGTFQTACAFFSFMYLNTLEDINQVLRQVSRGLESGAEFHLWDVDLAEIPESPHSTFIVHLEYSIAGNVQETGYGARWPSEPRGVDHFLKQAEDKGFEELERNRVGKTFYLRLKKL